MCPFHTACAQLKIISVLASDAYVKHAVVWHSRYKCAPNIIRVGYVCVFCVCVCVCVSLSICNE